MARSGSPRAEASSPLAWWAIVEELAQAVAERHRPGEVAAGQPALEQGRAEQRAFGAAQQSGDCHVAERVENGDRLADGPFADQGARRIEPGHGVVPVGDRVALLMHGMRLGSSGVACTPIARNLP